VPVPDLRPHRSPELWKRNIRTIIEKMSELQVIAVALLGVVLGAGLDWWLDHISNYDFIQTAIYMIPVGFAAWAAGLRVGAFVGLVAVSVEVFVSSKSIGGRHAGSILIYVYLLESITTAAGIFLMARMRYLLEEERQLSRMDYLTGVSNGRAFWEDLEVELERMRRDLKPLTVVFIDVDNFKQVNDKLGHKAGDDVLQCIGTTMKKVTRVIDVVARIGGDEFAMLLPGADVEAGKTVAERLRATVAAQCNVSDIATLSIGIAAFLQPPESAESLIVAADRLMYEAKGNGKNRIASRVF
jgi:diguanylate cyclase (GGDEF)-like protein